MKTNRKFMFLIAGFILIVNLAFAIVAVNYATRRDLDGNVPMGSLPRTCNTLASAVRTVTVSPTATAVVPGTVVTPSATPNPLLGQGGGAVNTDLPTATMWIEVIPSAVRTVTVSPTATAVVPGTVVTPSATPNPLLGQGGGPVITGLPTATSSATQNNWTISFFDGATADMLAYQFPVLNPQVWGTFPNVDNLPAAGFLAANGLEYGEDESQTCGSGNDACDLVIAARSYVIITGDYALDGIGSCSAANSHGRGCAIMITNVGDVSGNLTGRLDNVFVIYGRYWNGDRNFLPTAIVAGLSHATHNMLNLNSTLNPTGATNAGGNCSVPSGCTSVNVSGVIVSGNQPLVAISTIANR